MVITRIVFGQHKPKLEFSETEYYTGSLDMVISSLFDVYGHISALPDTLVRLVPLLDIERITTVYVKNGKITGFSHNELKG